jgi:squalene cyclase
MRQLSFLCALLLLLVTALPVLGQGDTASAIEWLRGQVREDGGFTDGFNEESGVSPTTEAVYAAVAAGEDVSTWGDDASPLDFLAANAEGIDTTGTLAKVILAARATGQDATNFGGVNLVERLNARYNSGSGLFEGIVTEHAYAMLALAVTGNEVPEAARQALVDLQDDEGGWAFDGTSQADTNTTALAIQALLAVGEETHSEPVSQALAFLAGQQNEDGGFPYQTPSDYGTDSDANSTAWAIQALVAAGEDPGEWNNPQEFLASGRARLRAQTSWQRRRQFRHWRK